MTFDCTIANNHNIENGVVKGDNRIVLIKPGLGGSCLGYENKYLRIAQRLNQNYGCSVISIANPRINPWNTDIDARITAQYVYENNIKDPELYFLGHSNGGIKGLEIAASGIFFRRMVLINAPLLIDMHKTKEYLAAIRDTDVIMFYGEKDPSYRYMSFVEGKYKNVKLLSVANADHNFKDMLDEFIALSDLVMQQSCTSKC